MGDGDDAAARPDAAAPAAARSMRWRLIGGLALVVGGVVALGMVLLGSVLMAWWLTRTPDALPAGMLALPLAAGMAATVVGSHLLQPVGRPDGGLLIETVHHPALAALLEEVAARVGTPVPDEVRLVPEARISVVEEARLLGLVPGRRMLAVGMPLLGVLDAGQVRALLAHELSLHRPGRTDLTTRVRVTRRALRDLTARSGGPISARVLGAWAAAVLSVTGPVVRAQVHRADRTAVAVGGRRTLAQALRTTATARVRWAGYLAEVLVPALAHRAVPRDLLGGFREMARHDRGWRTDLAHPAPADPGEDPAEPPPSARIAAVLALPDPQVPADTRPGRTLLTDVDAIEAVLARQLGATLTGGTVQEVGWDVVTELHARSASRMAERLLRAAEGLDPAPGTLRDLLALTWETAPGSSWSQIAPRASAEGPDGNGSGPLERRTTTAASAVLAQGLVNGGATWRMAFDPAPHLRLPDGRTVSPARMVRAWRRTGSTAEVEAALAAVGLGLDSPLSRFRPAR